MSRTSQAAQAVATVRDILSRHENIPKIADRLATGAENVQTLPHNPPQPRKLLRQPLTGPLTTTRYTYPDGSTAVLQHQVPDPASPNAAAHIRTWVERPRKTAPQTPG